MNPNEVINQLEKLGVEISRATLLRYEKQELIPLPKRGGGGAGGRWTDYPPDTVAEAYAAWALMHGHYATDGEENIFIDGKPPKLSVKFIASSRRAAVEYLKANEAAHKSRLYAMEQMNNLYSELLKLPVDLLTKEHILELIEKQRKIYNIYADNLQEIGNRTLGGVISEFGIIAWLSIKDSVSSYLKASE